MSELNEHPLHRSLNRPNLLMGVDRELLLTSGFFSALMIFTVQSWAAAAFGVALWVFSIYLLRKAAKSDPQMRQVYLRFRNYRKFYSARPTAFRKE